MRTELIHPMLVHFPIALLLMGTLLRAITFLFRRTHFYLSFVIASWFILSLGVCFAWLAVLAGEFAKDIVGKNLCDEMVLYKHFMCAYTTAYIFTAALLLDFARAWMRRKLPAFNKVAVAINFLLFLAGASLLMVTGSFGASLVYEQGAAVDKCCKEQGAP